MKIIVSVLEYGLPHEEIPADTLAEAVTTAKAAWALRPNASVTIYGHEYAPNAYRYCWCRHGVLVPDEPCDGEPGASRRCEPCDNEGEGGI
jgi:hypothetical protein